MAAASSDGGVAITEAAEHLRAGRLVAFPTETVYGLGGDATSDRAVARIFDTKARPRFNPLIVHVPDSDAARRLVEFTPEARRLTDLFWPGPLTLVLPRRPDCPVSLLAGAGLETLAVRMPGHPVALALLRAVGRPIAAPSANRSGRVSPTLAEHVREELGASVALVLDGGSCRVGVESTVLDLTRDPPVLLRPGGVAREALEGVLGPLGVPDSPADGVAPSSPGMLASHYAPALPVRLNVLAPLRGEAWLGFGPTNPQMPPPDLQLSATGDPIEAAAALFAALRALDRTPFTAIAVMPIPEAGLGAAINDRLRRAAAPRR
ncbi:MAG: L-threonylcarbamoyladenylate synthase [Aliidongia sp.]|jgi:L-threonylcarbamoyladenylate synthase|nr:L-threonylcarbamoyladenylate synthase [Aliidongia sp.]